jgi:uncharacterized protein DUF4382
MGGAGFHRLSQAWSTLFPLTTCLLCAAACNNTCVSGTLNAPGGSTVNVKVASPPPSCTLTTANGIVHLEIGAAPGATSAPGITGPHMTHLFVTLAGVDVHSSPLASDETPGWLPLASELQGHPLQVDLLEDAHANASSAPFPDAVLPAGAYRQIRLRFAGLPQGPAGLEANPCGAGAPHCAVLSDGRVQPLALPPSRPDLRIVLEGVPGHGLYVPPDGAVTLVLELDRDRSWVWRAGDALLFAPVFRLSVRQALNLAEN